MEGVLQMQIQHKVFNHFIVGIVKQPLDNQGAYNHVHWSVWPCRSIFTVEDRKTFLIYGWEYFIREYF